jgi:hypothetical protein
LEFTEQNPDGSWKVRQQTDYKKLFTLMANLVGFQEHFLRKMHPRDLERCAMQLRSFFIV